MFKDEFPLAHEFLDRFFSDGSHRIMYEQARKSDYRKVYPAKFAKLDDVLLDLNTLRYVKRFLDEKRNPRGSERCDADYHCR